MGIDIERLKVDAAYWDEVAPDGATHFVEAADEALCDVFWRVDRNEGVEAWAVCDNGVKHYPDPIGVRAEWNDAIPRPTAKEWDEGGCMTPEHGPQAWDGEGVLPGIGEMAQVAYTPEEGRWWPNAKLLALHDGIAVFVREGKRKPLVRELQDVWFRPIKSAAERKRDEAISAAWEIFKPHADSEFAALEGLQKLYDAGLLRKREG